MFSTFTTTVRRNEGPNAVIGMNFLHHVIVTIIGASSFLLSLGKRDGHGMLIQRGLVGMTC